MSARCVAWLDEERAQRAVGQSVRGEVQVVEDHQRPERERRVERATRGTADDRARAELFERPDVRSVRDLVREAHVPGAMARDVDRLDPGVLDRG